MKDTILSLPTTVFLSAPFSISILNTLYFFIEASELFSFPKDYWFSTFIIHLLKFHHVLYCIPNFLILFFHNNFILTPIYEGYVRNMFMFSLTKSQTNTSIKAVTALPEWFELQYHKMMALELNLQSSLFQYINSRISCHIASKCSKINLQWH
jgi:hypothetical protein